MRLPPLVPALLHARRKRFLADVELPDGARAVAHLANPGRMTRCLRELGPTPCWLSAARPGRALPWTVELTRPDEALVLVNPLRANTIVGEALGRLFPGEAPAGAEVRRLGRRLDHRLVGPAGERWVEVKAATLVRDGLAAFPDAPSVRAVHHLAALEAAVAEGARATLVVLVGREDARAFTPADDVDPAWGRALRRALEAGVELQVWRASVSLDAVTVDRPLPML